ncbi:Cadmium resistance transcriptional regulatory protein CadC homolog [Tepidanaerobacter acetatoxydans Re1]|uniref:Cadmium resistance transcriptional regulatory protein CadC homolog n=1 Tax=Tepidanaerobacter acetatoxydans (strain DSM 21804 / JCM 16047 / Re1) TaxID=1209989 RepID=F4LWA7_TEPAE|nr:metalloregulator ArsR/SmtB family transcription factor [Tepidanaerobacter acetatoxydans]AEE91705.1 transcriptional regulator, ArsR family [Tepidanaerobacter acetatoxydans Re1]CCP26466.1 Cadmium resistance transcriptional regulatory protein CadC homolog [Tepidanaerobacter acetatoxydans Re1]
MDDNVSEEKDVCEVFCIEEDKVRRLANTIPDMLGLADLFKVLADETRVKIVYILSKEELCVCDIAALLNSTVSNISHHLRVLRTAHLVKFRREGKQVYYTLDDEHVVHIIKEGFEHVNHIHQEK